MEQCFGLEQGFSIVTVLAKHIDEHNLQNLFLMSNPYLYWDNLNFFKQRYLVEDIWVLNKWRTFGWRRFFWNMFFGLDQIHHWLHEHSKTCESWRYPILFYQKLEVHLLLLDNSSFTVLDALNTITVSSSSMNLVFHSIFDSEYEKAKPYRNTLASLYKKSK